MIDADVSLCSLVRGTFSKCYGNDTKNPKHYNANTRAYNAPFEVYRKCYEPLEKYGIQILDPIKLGYSPGRKGSCSDFVAHFLYPENGYSMLNQILKSPETKNPNNGDIVCYYGLSSPNSFETSQGLIEIEVQIPFHLGILWYVKDDMKAISKFGEGPVVVGPIQAQPFTNLFKYTLLDSLAYSKDVIIIKENPIEIKFDKNIIG